MSTKLSRRDFMRLCAGSAAVVSLSGFLGPFVKEAVASGAPPVIWIQGGSCSGCSVSLLNTVHPDIEKVLMEVISLRYHQTLMAGQGDAATEVLFTTAQENRGKYILVVEGAVPTGANGRFCMIGERNGNEVTFKKAVEELGAQAMAILSVGTCAAFGGIPAADPNPTDAKPVSDIVKGVPIINIPGCPSHPDWIVGTIAHILLYNELPALDKVGRPTMFYGGIVHDNCPRRQYFDNGIFAKKFGDEGCLLELGCKGPIAHCDSTKRFWNNGVNSCINAGAPCIACTEPKFPAWPIYEKTPEMPIGPGMTASVDKIGAVLGAAAAVGIGGHVAGKVITKRKNSQGEGEE